MPCAFALTVHLLANEQEIVSSSVAGNIVLGSSAEMDDQDPADQPLSPTNWRTYFYQRSPHWDPKADLAGMGSREKPDFRKRPF